jgi:hypothetical protein
MVSAFNAKLAVYGQWTYRVAWALEIVAASIGLATGLALGYQAYSASVGTELSVSGLDLALASAPFFMVALAELTKIPITTLLFSVRWIWKPVLAIALCLLALITFETVFLGLERASTQRQIQYEEIQSRKNTAQTDLQNTEKSLANLAAASHVADVKAEVDKLNEMEASEVQRKQGEIQQIQSQIENLKMQNPQYASLARQIAAKDTEFKQLIERRDNEIRIQLEPFERQRDSFTKRIEAAREKGDVATVRRLEDELARLRNPLPAIRERFGLEEQRLQSDLRGLRDQQVALENSETDAEKQARSRLVERQNVLEQEVRGLQTTWQGRRNLTLSQLQDAQQKAAQNTAEADRLRTRVSQLQNELTVLEKERVVTSRNDQIRRLAGRFYGKNPEAVSVEEAGFISVVVWVARCSGGPCGTSDSHRGSRPAALGRSPGDAGNPNLLRLSAPVAHPVAFQAHAEGPGSHRGAGREGSGEARRGTCREDHQGGSLRSNPDRRSGGRSQVASAGLTS